MQVRVLKRAIFWGLQAAVVTGAAWGLLRWTYETALEDLVPLRIATAHDVTMLLVTMTLVTGGLAGVMSLIFATRVEWHPLTNAGGVAVCTCAALGAYLYLARFSGEEYETSRYFLAGTSYQVYAGIVVLGVAMLNGVLSLMAGVLNPRRAVLDEPAAAAPRPRRLRMSEVVAVEPPTAVKQSLLGEGDEKGGKTGKAPGSRSARKRR